MSEDNPQVPNRGLLTICVMAATIMQALDTTIANVALPYMQGSLSATQDQITWVLTSYIVAAAIFMPTTGFLAARFGRKKLLITAVAGFTIASGLCGAAQTLGQMVIFRLLQGVFGAALVPMSQAILLDSYPREKHGSAMALWGVGVMVGPILGPMLGGWLTEYYNWRWVFYINVPIGVAVVFGLMAVLTESKIQQMRFDWFGFATLSLAVGALQMMLDRGQLVDWFSSTEIIFEAALAILALYLFLVHMATAEKPFIDPHLFTDHNFRVGIMLIFVVGVILLASVALLTPYLQTLMGYPVLTAGLILGPRGIGNQVGLLGGRVRRIGQHLAAAREKLHLRVEIGRERHVHVGGVSDRREGARLVVARIALVGHGRAAGLQGIERLVGVAERRRDRRPEDVQRGPHGRSSRVLTTCGTKRPSISIVALGSSPTAHLTS